MSVRVSLAGGAGYTGGELLRLFLGHPQIEVGQIISRTYAGQPVQRVHPHLRGAGLPNFVEPAALAAADVLILALPHGQTQRNIGHYAGLAPRIIDLSADFRLHNPDSYEKWYGEPHAAPEWLGRFVYGLPEIYRERLRGTNYVSGVGCNATASILALLPLVRSGLLRDDRPITIEIKTGSSEGGATANPGSHHPLRTHVVRSYAPVGHRHTAEVQQALGLDDVHLSLTAVELVRGASATAQAWVSPATTEKDLWRAWRATYKPEPFVRIVRERQGNYRRPEPKILAGSNYADVSFDLDPDSGRVVAICAIDNLMKGAAGSAVQCLNLMLGLDETVGLTFTGLHPI